MENFRKIETQNECSDTLFKIQLEEKNLLVWTHNSETENREKHSLIIEEVHLEDEGTLLSLSSSENMNMNMNMNKGDTLYLYNESYSFLTKSVVKKIKGKRILISLPNDVYLKEKRISERFCLTEKKLKIKYKSYFAERVSNKVEQGVLNDISNTCISLEISMSKLLDFEVGHQIDILSIGEHSITTNLKGVISHISETKKERSAIVKIGVFIGCEGAVLERLIEQL